MNDLRLEAMDAPLVRHYHDQAERCLEKMESSWSPVSRWLWDRRLKAANTMWREVLKQEINQLRAERGMTLSTGASKPAKRRMALETAASRIILD